MEKNGIVIIFHDEHPCVLKEIKFFLETNGYEIHFKWVVINCLLRMSSRIKGKMVIFILNFIYITLHSIESYWTNFYHSQSFKFNWVVQLFLFELRVDSNFKNEDDIFPNHIYINTMEKSSKGLPFKRGQEMHVSTSRTFIHFCNPFGFLVVTMNSSIGISFSLLFAIFKQQFVLLDD